MILFCIFVFILKLAPILDRHKYAMTQPITAFADEFGNNSFDFQTQGSHFIVATVITKTENIETLKSKDSITNKVQQHIFELLLSFLQEDEHLAIHQLILLHRYF